MPTTYRAQTVVVIFNPIAGRGKSEQAAQMACQHLRESGSEVIDVVATRYAGHARQELVAAWCHRVDLIVVVGGDGTLREVAAGLIEQKKSCVVGFIPFGNANVVARELGIPVVTEEAVALLSQARVRRIDMGQFTTSKRQTEYFLAMIELGHGARIVHGVDRLRLGALQALYRWFGDLVYGVAGLLAMGGKPLAPFTVDNGKGADAPFYSAWICSMACYSKGWSVCPEACADNGLLHYLGSRRSSFSTFLLHMLYAVRRKPMRRPWLQATTGTSFEIRSDEDLWVQADGDPVVAGPMLSISLLPSVLNMLVPSASAVSEQA